MKQGIETCFPPCVKSRYAGLFACLAAACLLISALPAFTSGAEVNLVIDGNPAAVVVICPAASPLEVYAAEEFIEHVREATGAVLPLAREPEIPGGYKSMIFIGDTAAARAAGIDVSLLGTDESVLRVSGPDLYVAGKKAPGMDPLDVYTRPSGTLFGVYEIIERFLGVIWAWPGELGRYVPAAGNLAIGGGLDEKFSPPIGARMPGGRYTVNIARGISEYDRFVKRISFSRAGLEGYAHDVKTYLRRHRMGRGEGVPAVGHEFTNWWNRYGEDNPEWFMMDEEGNRGAAGGVPSGNVAMCVSNPELQRFIVERWDKNRNTLRAGEVDGREYCRCPDCKAWDGPQPGEGDVPHFVSYPRYTSDRYARFWKAVYGLAVRHNPDVRVSTYLYNYYAPAPVEVTALGPGIWGYFTPWGGTGAVWFPMLDEALEWKKAQWKGWADTGMSMVYRPNYLHGGYAMPYLETSQSGEMFKYAYENGMKGAFFDTLCGEWAVQGPMLYMHMRLISKPYLEVADVLDEYYSVFGPAEENVREYFSYWEDYAIANNVSRRMRWRRFNLIAHEAYPPECFPPAEGILEDGLKAAMSDVDPVYMERVLFLRAGLEHARLAGRLAAVFDGDREIPRGTERFRMAQQALAELVRFRRAHEDMNIFDFTYTASKELRPDNWNLNALFE